MASKHPFLQYLTLVLTLLLRGVFAADPPAPFEVKWASESFGFDGPWNAVKTTIGDYYYSSNLSLFPGAFWETWVISDEQCNQNSPDGCYASKAGLYDEDTSAKEGSGSDLEIRLESSLDIYQQGLEVVGEDPKRWTDSLSLGDSAEEDPVIYNVSLNLLTTQKMQYPGGQTYPLSAGCFSLGAPNVNHSFTMNDGSPSINASIVSGNLWEKGRTPSNSFGMHVGSASPRDMSGSLWFGGYDGNRVAGPVLSVDGTFRDGFSLDDISIEVVNGSSPFDFESQDGLLSEGNSTIIGSLGVQIDGCSPYLTLPKSTCDNIARHLPVNFDEDLGLYLWDIKSPSYKDIVSSASVLAFSFTTDSNAVSIKINVPFRHLNLTLTSPLVDDPTPYFPCYVGGHGTYVLGRAFLQDAFLGANWGLERPRTFLAQAPGPNIQALPRRIAIAEDTDRLEDGKNDWKASWEGMWDYSGNGGGNKIDPEPAPPNDEGLSTGAKAGIGVGASVGALAIFGALIWLCLRRRKNRSVQSEADPAVSQIPSDGKPPENRFTLQSEYTTQSGLSPRGEYASEMPTREANDVSTRHELGDTRRDEAMELA